MSDAMSTDALRPESLKINSCNLCGRQVSPAVLNCDECADWLLYWEELTPDQRVEELRSMHRHVIEEERRLMEASRRHDKFLAARQRVRVDQLRSELRSGQQ